mmetsp:Transcript_46507/g.68746  ORF Transcript_46507/g.68746 Transcript_46507/m.68746 type:complete len:95 (-) Transcript_46507:65-349(-)
MHHLSALFSPHFLFNTRIWAVVRERSMNWYCLGKEVAKAAAKFKKIGLRKLICLRKSVLSADGHLRGGKSGNDAGMKLRAAPKAAMRKGAVLTN